MEEFFVSYDLAVKLRVKGYDWPCMAYFTYTHRRLEMYTRILTSLCTYADLNEGYTLAPLWQQAIGWVYAQGIIVRSNGAGDGYEIRCKEWGVDSFVGVYEISDAIDQALSMLDDKF